MRYQTRALFPPLTCAEETQLKDVAHGHTFADCRRRVQGILSLAQGYPVSTIAAILGVSGRTVYNWARWWREQGLSGLLGGHEGGRPLVLSEALVEEACAIAKAEALTLHGIKQRLRERHPDAPQLSEGRLAVRLKEHGFSFKRCRWSLKKNAMKHSSDRPNPFSSRSLAPLAPAR